MLLTESIEAHFDEILRAKDELRRLVGEFNLTAENDITLHMKATEASWMDMSSEKLLRKETRIYEDMLKETGIVLSIVDDIDRTAEHLYRIESINSAMSRHG